MPDYLKDAIEKAKKAKRPKDTTPSANVFSNQPTTAQMDQKIETVQAATTEPAPFATNAPAQAVEYAPEELDPEEEVRERTASQIPGKTVEKSGDALIVQYPDRELLEYRVPIPKPTLGEKTIINIIKEAATQLISISPYRIRDPEQRRPERKIRPRVQPRDAQPSGPGHAHRAHDQEQDEGRAYSFA
jgi:hypothetical protein